MANFCLNLSLSGRQAVYGRDGGSAAKVWRVANSGGYVIPTDKATTTTNMVLSTKVRKAQADISKVKFVDVGWVSDFNNSNFITDVGADIIINRWIEYPIGSAPQQILYSGVTNGTIPNGGKLVSDALNITIPSGSLYKEHIAYNVTNANITIPLINNTVSNTTLNATQGEATANRATLSGFPATPLTDGSSGRWQCGGFMISEVAASQTSVVVIGDSRAGHGKYAPISYGISGDIAPAVAAANVPVAMASNGGQKIANLADLPNKVYDLFKYFSHAIVAIGINDLNSANSNSSNAQIEPFKRRIARRLNNLGVKQVWTTCFPVPTGSAGWDTDVTLAAQAANANDAQRVSYNTDLRASKDGIAYYEFADVMESSRNSGKLKATLGIGVYTFEATGSLLHFTKTGDDYLASQVSGSALVAAAGLATSVPETSLDLNLTGATFSATGLTGCTSALAYGAGKSGQNFTIDVGLSGIAATAAIQVLWEFGGIRLQVAATTGLVSLVINGTSVATSTTAIASITNIRCSFGTAGSKLIINGVVEATTATKPNSTHNFAAPVSLRKRSDGSFATTGGEISQFAIWAADLPSAYTPSTLVGDEANLWMLYKLDGNGTAIKGAEYTAIT